MCSTPLALINGVLNAETGCNCSTSWNPTAMAMINSNAATSVFGAAAAAPLIATGGTNHQLNLTLVAASPLYCPFPSSAARFFDIFPLYYTQPGVYFLNINTLLTNSENNSIFLLSAAGSTIPLDFNTLVRAWSLGSGWVVYAGVGILPEDQVFGSSSSSPSSTDQMVRN